MLGWPRAHTRESVALAGSPSCSAVQSRAFARDPPDHLALPGDTESVHSLPGGRVKREGVQCHDGGLLPTAAPAQRPPAGQIGQCVRPGIPGYVDGAPAGC